MVRDMVLRRAAVTLLSLGAVITAACSTTPAPEDASSTDASSASAWYGQYADDLEALIAAGQTGGTPNGPTEVSCTAHTAALRTARAHLPAPTGEITGLLASAYDSFQLADQVCISNGGLTTRDTLEEYAAHQRVGNSLLDRVVLAINR